MTCKRCDGLMVNERICDLRGTGTGHYMSSVRGLDCGNGIDTAILEYRLPFIWTPEEDLEHFLAAGPNQRRSPRPTIRVTSVEREGNDGSPMTGVAHADSWDKEYVVSV